MPILMIPALSLLGTTNEPAWMQGVGPISMEVAKRLTSQASSFFRVLVDPISNDLLDKAPESYRITKAMRTMLLLRDEYCQFPGCMAKASSSQIDHIQSFESGGTSVFGNLEALCLHHHLVKHFKDDKSRNGQYRTDQGPERQAARLRGWTPTMTDSGCIEWRSPTGRYYVVESNDRPLVDYPTWLQILINESIATARAEALRCNQATAPLDLIRNLMSILKSPHYSVLRARTKSSLTGWHRSAHMNTQVSEWKKWSRRAHPATLPWNWQQHIPLACFT